MKNGRLRYKPILVFILADYVPCMQLCNNGVGISTC